MHQVLTCECGSTRAVGIPEGSALPPFKCARCVGDPADLDVANLARWQVATLKGWDKYSPACVECADGEYRDMDAYQHYRYSRRRKLRFLSPQTDLASRWKRTSAGLFIREEWHAKLDVIGWAAALLRRELYNPGPAFRGLHHASDRRHFVAVEHAGHDWMTEGSQLSVAFALRNSTTLCPFAALRPHGKRPHVQNLAITAAKLIFLV
jgi:hypothetical protein